MRLTPLDIRQQQFTVKSFRGFDRQEVDAFVEDVADDYEALLRENASLKEQLVLHEERARTLGETERALKDALVTSQRLADEMKEHAKREVQIMLREASVNGDRLMEDARVEEAKLRAEVKVLKRMRRRLAEDLRATMERYQRALAGDLEGEGADAGHDG